MSELELKLRLPEEVLETLRQAFQAHAATPLRLQATYHDTADGLLGRHAIALRLRQEGPHWVQTLKAPGDGAVHRLEHEVPLEPVATIAPVLDVRRHDGSAAGQVLAHVLRDAPDTTLIARHGTDVLRLLCRLRDADGTEIEASLDIGHAHAGGRSSPIAEVELEHKGGPAQGVFDLAGAWILHGGLWLSTLSKAERGERLLSADAEPRASKAAPLRLDAHANGAALLRALLQSALAHVLANAGELADGGASAEVIHQVRVGLRRLRTVLRELAALSPAIVAEWDTSLSATFGALGQQRDQEAVATAVQPLLEAAGAPLVSWQPQPAADPVQAVRERRFQATLVAILALAHAGDEHFAQRSAAQTKQFVGKRLRTLHRQVVRDGGRFEQLPLDDQHRVRKRLKRLRYLVDFTASMWPRDAVRRYLKRLGAAQDALGHHNDVAVAAAAFRGDAKRRPDAWFAAGYLEAHLQVTARGAQDALKKVRSAKTFWR